MVKVAMTPPAPQEPRYIITGEELERACAQLSGSGYGVSANYIDAMVRSRPAPSPDALIDKIIGYIQKHEYMSSGVTEHKKWLWSESLVEYIATLRQQQQEHP